jgi:hypothetical protein
MIRKAVILFIFSSMMLVNGNLYAVNLFGPDNIKDQAQAGQIADSLKWSIDFLNKLLYSRGEWYLTDNSYWKPVKGVLNYAENEPEDTVITTVRRILHDDKMVYLMDRRPQDIRNRKEIPGYISDEDIKKEIAVIKKKVIDSLNINNIVVPMVLLETELSKAPYVPVGDPHDLLGRKQRDLPPEFVTNFNKRVAGIQFPADMKGESIDSVRYQLFITYRKEFNDSVINSWRERVVFSYRSKYIAEQADLRIRNYMNLVDEQNYQTLTAYNDKAVIHVNDSLKIALQFLIAHIEADSMLVRLFNIKDEKTELWTSNHDTKPIRMFLKNAQNDSLSVVLMVNGKGELKLVIDDGIKLTRFSESQNRSITFKTKAPDKRLQKVNLNKVVFPPWTLIGNGSVGFTQTSLSNWAKGGESSLTLLIMTKYNANYSKNMVRWENSGEFRYGISKNKSRGLEKNEDKIEFQSRFGYSAFKKWYYSAETNFRTQIARGYKFPDKVNPISSFMAPGYLTLSLGMDYKPNKNFSLFLSPLTSKTTYIKDTVLIAPSKFGLEPGEKKLWEPGIIAKANWHQSLSENIIYDTKFEFFNNYRYTLRKFAVGWEQILNMQINRRINAMIMTQLIYDYNTKFPILDADGKEIGREPKWQFQELFNIGFRYRL